MGTRRTLPTLVGLLVVLTALPFASPVTAASPNVVISQVYGGGGNSGATLTHDFIELFNRGASSVSLGGWSVQYASSAGTSWQRTDLTAVTLQPGQYYLVQEAQGAGGTTPLPTPDATGAIAMSATGAKVALVQSTTTITGGTSCPLTGFAVVDFVGYGSTTNCSETEPAPTLSNTQAAARNGNGCTDTDHNTSDFTVGAPAPRNTSTALSPCPVERTLSINNVSQDEGNSGTTSFDFTVSLSSAAPAGGVNFNIATDDGTATVADNDYTAKSLTDQTIPAGETNYAFSVLVNGDATDEADETFFVNVTQVTGATVADGQGQGTIEDDDTDVCELPYTPIYDIQGDEASAAMTGPVTTQGVVIGDYEGPSPTLRGFYIQDATGDGDGETSDAIFVFNGNDNEVSLGDLVRVSGTASDFQDQTQISTTSNPIDCGDGTVTPTNVSMPFPAPIAGEQYLERFEGMLVRFPQTLYVTEHFQLGRFGQVVMSSGDRLFQPTNLLPPGPDANALQAANNLNRIIVDDDLQNQNADPIVFGRGGAPLTASNTLRGGDTATGMVGVMSYTWAGSSASGNAFRLRPVSAMGGGVPDFQPDNQRPTGSPGVGGTLRVSNFNVLNFFNTFGSSCTLGVGGAPTSCRGAENTTEFDRQTEKIVAAIVGLDADVVGLMEVENDGYGPTSAIAALVDALNTEAGAGTWAFIDADAETGQLNSLGTDAIKNGLIYRPASVTPTGNTAVLNSIAFVNGGDGVPRSRPALTQAFMENATGEAFIASVQHLKSKGSACDAPDAGDGQGNCNTVRLNAVRELMDWLDADPTHTGDPDILILGDMNSYAREDPIRALEDGGYTNLVPWALGEHAYSFVFDAQWGALDHALGSFPFLSQVTGVAEWHINSDEPPVLDYNTNFKTPGQIASLYAPDEFRSSDHDPVVIGLSLVTPAGKVTGGGAFVDGSFSIAAEYDHDTGLLTGSTTIDLIDVGTLTSTDYDWLVIDGNRAAYAGTGTVDGVSGFGFWVSVKDGGTPGTKGDRIRVKVWDQDRDLVYDSQPGDGITASPTEPLTAGNLIVHKRK